MKKMKTPSIVALVWRNWAAAFRRNAPALVLSLVFYNLAAFIDQMLKPTFFKRLFDELSLGKDPMYLVYCIIGCHAANWLVSRLGDYCITVSESDIIRRLRNSSLYGLMKKNTDFFSNNYVGSLVAKSKRYSVQSEQVIDQIMFMMSRTTLLVLYLVIYMFIIMPDIAYVLVAWIIVFASFTVFISKVRLKSDIESAKKDSNTTGAFSDIVSSLSYLRVFSRENKEYENFKKVSAEEMKFRRKAWYLGNIQWAVQALLVATLEVVVIFLVIGKIQSGEQTFGTLAMIQVYIISLAMNMYSLGQSLIKMRTGLADAHEMAVILDEQSDETEDVVASQALTLADNSVILKDVKFSYPNGEIVLDGLSFKFESGMHYGIVGSSGAGKSTLVKVLLAFYQQSKGTIEIGGNDTRNISKCDLRSLISYVPQQPAFPSRRIIDILSLGNEHASMDEVIDACTKTGCDFIWKKFPNGFETYVGERGVKLSGGEAQRLAMATAILKNSSIVVMDEPTSALDAETERFIQFSIKSHFKGKTLIVIAHRLSTVAVLDEVAYMKDGRITMSLPHEDLLVANDEYRNMWELQTNPNIVIV